MWTTATIADPWRTFTRLDSPRIHSASTGGKPRRPRKTNFDSVLIADKLWPSRPGRLAIFDSRQAGLGCIVSGYADLDGPRRYVDSLSESTVATSATRQFPHLLRRVDVDGLRAYTASQTAKLLSYLNSAVSYIICFGRTRHSGLRRTIYKDFFLSAIAEASPADSTR